MQRLGASKLDLVLIHDISPRAHGPALEVRLKEVIAGALPTVVELRERGHIGAIGLGVSDWRVCLRLAREARFDAFLLACSYTLLDQEPLDEFLPFCAEQNISVIAAAPFVSGILATGTKDRPAYFYTDAPADIVERVRRIEAVCARHKVALPAAALQMPVAHPAVASVLPGYRTPAEVAANLRHFTAPIPAAFWHDLKQAGLIDARTPTP